MKTTTDEMPLAAALTKAQEFWPQCPIFAIKQAIREGVIPSRRSSQKARARYYVRWPVLQKYIEGLQA